MLTLGWCWAQRGSQPPLAMLMWAALGPITPFVSAPHLVKPVGTLILLPNTQHKGRAPQQQVAEGGGHCQSLPGVKAAHAASLALALQPLPASSFQVGTGWTAHRATTRCPKWPCMSWQSLYQEQESYSQETNFIHRTDCTDFSL